MSVGVGVSVATPYSYTALFVLIQHECVVACLHLGIVLCNQEHPVCGSVCVPVPVPVFACADVRACACACVCACACACVCVC